MKSIRLLWLGVSFMIASSLCVAPLLAQTSTTGALKVTVTDRGGAVIPGASVTVTNTAMGLARKEITGEQGSYTFSLLPVGGYSVVISEPGFDTVQIPSVIINVTETRALTQVLEIGASQQEITVVAETRTSDRIGRPGHRSHGQYDKRSASGNP